MASVEHLLDEPFVLKPVTRRQRQHRLDVADYPVIADLYRTGATQKELGERYKVNEATISRLLQRLGTESRQNLAFTDKEVLQIRMLRDEGWTLARIGERYGRSGSSVWRALHRN